jgi:lipoprotein signal peptidase
LYDQVVFTSNEGAQFTSIDSAKRPVAAITVAAIIGTAVLREVSPEERCTLKWGLFEEGSRPMKNERQA